MERHNRSLFGWIAAGVTGLLIFIFFFNHAFPVASIDIKFSKEQALKRAQNFIEAQGFDLKGYTKGIIFTSDTDASIYLQKTQGIKRANELIKKEIPVWAWLIRWFKELQKEGFAVFINPADGEVVGFSHSLLEDAKSTDLTETKALAMAEKVISLQGIKLQDYELKDKTAEKQKQRTDYHFSWEKKGYKINDATLRINAAIYGDKLGAYSRYLKVPEVFNRGLEKEASSGILLTMVSSIFMFLMLVATIFVLIVQHKQNKVNWKFGIFFATVVVALGFLSFFNSMPLLWISYPNTVSKTVFVSFSLIALLIGMIRLWVTIFVFGSSGDSLFRDLWPQKAPLPNAIKNFKSLAPGLIPVVTVGYSLAFAFLGYITLFYLAGAKLFNIWSPPNAEYSNILATAMPFLFPLTIAATAAISEEFMFRLFMISFLKKYLKLTWLAILIPALVWAFGHSNYLIFPAYVRGIELTIFGIVMGLVYLKYNLATVIIAHYVINASLVGLPLLKSHNTYFVSSGVIVIALAFVPMLVGLFAFRKQRIAA